jgi:hypothetical protein
MIIGKFISPMPGDIAPAVRTSFSCGHHETVGGNVADPSAIYAEMAGKMEFRTSPEICSICKDPVKYAEIINWRAQ